MWENGRAGWGEKGDDNRCLFQGPGIFFVIPCIDTYKKVDLRTVSFDVPPQEVRLSNWSTITQQSPRPRS